MNQKMEGDYIYSGQGPNINIGTLNKRTIEGMFCSRSGANELGHVTLLDPVGAGAGTADEYRRRTDGESPIRCYTRKYLRSKNTGTGKRNNKRGGCRCSRCRNRGESGRRYCICESICEKSGCIVAITGAIDLVSDGASCYIIRNGRPEMGKITGTGCQLSGMMTAFLAANPEQKLEAAAAAVCTMGLAGEIGWGYMQKGDGNATYRNRIIDAIYNMDKETLEKGAKYEIR